jgi:hypothetical protein
MQRMPTWDPPVCWFSTPSRPTVSAGPRRRRRRRPRSTPGSRRPAVGSPVVCRRTRQSAFARPSSPGADSATGRPGSRAPNLFPKIKCWGICAVKDDGPTAVASKHHVGQPLHLVQRQHFDSLTLDRRLQRLPLIHGLLTVHNRVRSHPRVDGVLKRGILKRKFLMKRINLDGEVLRRDHEYTLQSLADPFPHIFARLDSARDNQMCK